jgi:hypothetical protein
MANFSLEDGSGAAYSLEDAPKALQDAREATGEEVIVLIILCQELATAKRALHIIQRDLGSQLLQVEQCDTVVGAYLNTLRGFSPSECLSFYHYHLNRSLGQQAQVWITTKGGKL